MSSAQPFSQPGGVCQRCGDLFEAVPEGAARPERCPCTGSIAWASRTHEHIQISFAHQRPTGGGEAR